MSKVSELVAKELGLAEVEEGPAHVSFYGVTNVQIKSAGELYRIYLVNDENEEKSPLDESSKLAAFYNSQFILRSFQISKNPVSVGQHQTSFQIIDGAQHHSIYVLKVPEGELGGLTLNLPQLHEVAENLAKLHSIPSSAMSAELRYGIDRNLVVIKDFNKFVEPQILEVLTNYVQQQPSLFRRPESVLQKLEFLREAIAASEEEPLDTDNYEPVVCHGRLSGNTCVFNRGELSEICAWDAVHFGNPAEDLANLMVSSADIDVYHGHLMEVIRTYYYKLIDYRPLRFNLDYFRELFRRQLKKAVFNNIEPLLHVLSSDSAQDHKLCIVERWESALDEAYQFENGLDASDVEQAFFAKK